MAKHEVVNTAAAPLILLITMSCYAAQSGCPRIVQCQRGILAPAKTLDSCEEPPSAYVPCAQGPEA